MLGTSTSTTSLPAIKLKPFGDYQNRRVKIGVYDQGKFCKNGKTRRKYRRRRLNAEKRRIDFAEKKRRLLAQRSIVLPKNMKTKKPWTRVLTIFHAWNTMPASNVEINENAIGKCTVWTRMCVWCVHVEWERFTSLSLCAVLKGHKLENLWLCFMVSVPFSNRPNVFLILVFFCKESP